MAIFSETHAFFLAAWLTRELRLWDSNITVGKLNGENSSREKERMSLLFKEG